MVFCNFEMQICGETVAKIAKQSDWQQGRYLQEGRPGHLWCAAGGSYCLPISQLSVMTSQVSWVCVVMGTESVHGGVARWSLNVARGSRRAAFWSATFFMFRAVVGANLTCSTETVFGGVHMVFHIWHVQYDKKWWYLLSVRSGWCKSNMFNWNCFWWCAHGVSHLTCAVWQRKMMISTQCAQWLVQV